MHLTAKEKDAIFKKYGGDLKNNRKDKNTQRSLQLLVGKRRGLLDYLMNKDIKKYRALIKDLGIRR